MNNNKYDDIDKLFQTKLGGEKLGGADWNTPSDHVFGNAMVQMDEDKKKRRKMLIFWFGLGLIIFAITLFSFIALPNIKVQNDDLIEPHQAKNYVEDTKSIKENAGVTTRAGDGENKLIIEPPNEELINEISSKNNSFDVKDLNDVISSNSVFKEDVSFINTIEQSSPLMLVNDSISSVPKQTFLSSIEKIPALTLLQMRLNIPTLSDESPKENLIDAFVLHTIIADSSKVDLKKNRGRNAISIGAGSNFSSMRMINVPNTNASLTEYDNYYPGFNLNIAYERQWKPRISFQTQVGISQIRNKSTFVTEFDYDKSLEILDAQDKLMYDSEYSSANPLGEISTRLEMFVGDELMDDGSKMKQETRNVQQIWTVSAGVGIALNIVENDQFLWDLSGGVALNHLVSYQGSFVTEISNNDKLMFEESLLKNTTDHMNQNIMSVQLRSKLAYKVSNSLDLYVEGATNNYVQSMKQVKPNSPEKTFVNLMSISLGVKHHF